MGGVPVLAEFRLSSNDALFSYSAAAAASLNSAAQLERLKAALVLFFHSILCRCANSCQEFALQDILNCFYFKVVCKKSVNISSWIYSKDVTA